MAYRLVAFSPDQQSPDVHLQGGGRSLQWQCRQTCAQQAHVRASEGGRGGRGISGAVRGVEGGTGKPVHSTPMHM